MRRFINLFFLSHSKFAIPSSQFCFSKNLILVSNILIELSFSVDRKVVMSTLDCISNYFLVKTKNVFKSLRVSPSFFTCSVAFGYLKFRSQFRSRVDFFSRLKITPLLFVNVEIVNCHLTAIYAKGMAGKKFWRVFFVRKCYLTSKLRSDSTSSLNFIRMTSFFLHLKHLFFEQLYKWDVMQVSVL